MFPSCSTSCYLMPPPDSPPKSEAQKPNSMEAIMLLQQADGSWPFSELTCNLVSQSEVTMAATCPRGATKETWITAVMLLLLIRKYCSFLDELELVVMKAKKWLAGQDIPTTLTQLKEMAQVIVDSL